MRSANYGLWVTLAIDRGAGIAPVHLYGVINIDKGKENP